MSKVEKIIRICPEPHSQGFMFISECPISTCKNWSNRVRGKCITLALNFVDKDDLSIEELAYYREMPLNEAQTSLEHAVSNIKKLVLFNSYYEFCKNKPVRVGAVRTQHFGSWLNQYPLKLELWDVHNLPVLASMFCQNNWSSFVGSCDRNLSKDAKSLGLPQVLNLSKPSFKQIVGELNGIQ